MATPKEAIAKTPARRVRRTPIGVRNILTVTGKEPGYEYRIVNDAGDRVEEFKDNGWEVVEAGSVRVGEKRVDRGSTLGSAATVSVGGGTQGIVMRIPKEFYDEDQAAKQAYVNKTEESMREKALDGNYGKLEISRS